MTLGPCSSTLSSPLQYMQAQALLNQGKRTSRWNEAELQVQTYEAFILSMQSQQHVVSSPPVSPTVSAYVIMLFVSWISCTARMFE